MKTSIKLTYTPPSVPGLGGDAAKEWERTVVSTQEFVNRTKETVQLTRTTAQTVNVPPLSLRFAEYRVQSTSTSYAIEGDAIADVPLNAVHTRPAYERKFRVATPRPGGGTRWRTATQKVPAKDFVFDIGLWSYYHDAEARTIRQRATVTIDRETVIVGPLEIQFNDVKGCASARKAFEDNSMDVISLLRLAEGLSRLPPP